MRRAPTETSSRGWLLVGFIIVISVLLIAVVGVTFLLTEHLRVTGLRRHQARAFYLAQAGIMRALYDFRYDAPGGAAIPGVLVGERTVEAGPQAGTADDNVYTIQPVGSGGSQRDFFLVNMRGATGFSSANYCGGPKGRFSGWTVRNVQHTTGGSILTVTQMRINWNPVAGGEGVVRITLDGSNIWPFSCTTIAPNTWIDIPDQSNGPSTRWNPNRIWFTTTAAKSWIRVEFQMGDGTVREAVYDPSGLLDPVRRSTAEFTLKSVGEVRGGPFPFRLHRRIQAEYRICALAAATGAGCNSESEERRQQGALLSYQERIPLTAP